MTIEILLAAPVDYFDCHFRFRWTVRPCSNENDPTKTSYVFVFVGCLTIRNGLSGAKYMLQRI